MEATFYYTPLFIKSNGSLVKVMPKDIVCIEANRAYCNIYVSDRNKPFELCCSMGEVLRALPDGFLRHIGRSHSINMVHVEEINEVSVIMDNGLILTLSRKAMLSLRESITILG